MLASKSNPRFAHLSDNQLSDLYVYTFTARKPESMTDEELDAIENELFWIDDELCARDLPLPKTR